jgi:hypothetical protein
MSPDKLTDDKCRIARHDPKQMPRRNGWFLFSFYLLAVIIVYFDRKLIMRSAVELAVIMHPRRCVKLKAYLTLQFDLIL